MYPDVNDFFFLIINNKLIFFFNQILAIFYLNCFMCWNKSYLQHTWTCGEAKTSINSSFKYLLPPTDETDSMTSLHRATASPGGARDGDTTVDVMRSNNCLKT